MSESKNDIWSAGRVIQYLLIMIAISASSYIVAQINDLSKTVSDMEHRLIRMEEGTATIVRELEEETKDQEVRLNKVETKTTIHEGKISSLTSATTDHEVRLRTLEH